MYIFIENDGAYLVHEEIETQGYINGVVFYDPNYPDGAIVPIRIKKPGEIELLGNPCMKETAIKIKELIDKGVEVR